MTVAIIGLGLIGGSLALDLRANGFADRLVGVDANAAHVKKALELGLVDEVLSMEEACKWADVVVLAVPVSGILDLYPVVLDLIHARGVVVDMGSTKGEILRKIAGHPKRSRAVAAHPMAGTEFSGPEAAINHLFHGKAAIICDRENSDKDAINLAERLFKSLFMRIIYMDAREHDVHAAYVSHISHISSFVLALTVLDKEKSEANIFNMASGGFSSTVRLAKSSPRMWRDVYEQNSENILDVLNNYIEKMGLFRDLIASGEYDQTYSLMEQANAIGPILQGIK
ncbi:MAG: prephenate dehydrogenase [Bacteroidia bacterium]